MWDLKKNTLYMMYRTDMLAVDLTEKLHAVISLSLAFSF